MYNVRLFIMGEMIIIKDGIALTLHDDGSTSATKVDKCDYCNEWTSTVNGFSVVAIGGEVLTWLCAKCRG